jgi:hypothetical protein
MMREYRPMAAPFVERGVAEPPNHILFGRRIVRSDGNAQKSMTAPEKRASAECRKRGIERTRSRGIPRVAVGGFLAMAVSG